jgi:predicted permease
MVPETNSFLVRLKSLFRNRSKDRELAEELAFHQSLLRDKLLSQGVPPSQVDRELRRTFGNPARWHERLRELWQFRTIENLMRDVTFSVRMLKKSPGFTAIALLTLALGIGANTAVFSLVNGLLLRPLPVPHSDRLVVLGMDTEAPRVNYSFPAPFFRALEQKHELFQHAFAFTHREGGFLVRGKSANENVSGMLVSGEFFAALDTPAVLGRYLTPQDDQPGGSPQGFAAVISESDWNTRFSRAPDVIGQKLQIANTPFTIVGVMPKRFIGADPTQRPEIYAPLEAEPIIDAPQNMIAAGHHGWWLTLMARLNDGVSLSQVNAALTPMSLPILHATVPEADWIANQEKHHFHFVAEPGSRGFTYLRFMFQKPLMALFAMCGGILLLACMNLTSLLMARSAARERELATRLAMGATRMRLIQQLLIESLLVSFLGTLIGLALAPVVSHTLAATLMSDGGPDLFLDTSIDLRVLGFAAATACFAAIVIGLIPALQATSRGLNEQIKDGQHATHERKRIFPRILLATEVGLALLLVVSAGLLATSLTRLYKTDAGFDPRGVVNVHLDMDKQPLEGDALTRLYQQFVDRVAHQPGVTSVSLARIVPLTHFIWDSTHNRPGGEPHDLYENTIAPGYFASMKIAKLQGRDFSWSDTDAAGRKIILNQAAAKLFFPNQNPIGQTLESTDSKKKVPFEIVGVVADTKYEELRDPSPAAAYLPMTQFPEKKASLYLVIHTDSTVAARKVAFAASIRSLAANLAPDIPAPEITYMEKVVDDSISSERVMAILSLFFAGCALLVTAIGLYGTLAYNTARRTSEIGIRMALGAQRAGVVALVFRQNAVVAVAGCVAGLAAALFASRLLTSFLYNTSPRDPWILFLSVTALAIIASAASLLPAIRAARIEPITAIRCE